LIVYQQLKAQSSINSPYSGVALGDITNQGFVRDIGMAEADISNGDPYFINNINPALLTRNKLTIFESGVMWNYKKLSTEQASQRDATANVGYLALSFPAHKKWSTSIGLRPYSHVNYIHSFEDSVIQDSFSMAKIVYTGAGVINELYWANGIEIFKGFSLGIKTFYHFGSVVNESGSRLSVQGDSGEYDMVFYKRIKFAHLTFTPGFSFRRKIGNSLFLGIAATYMPQALRKATLDYNIQRKDAIGGAILSTETILAQDTGQIRLPDGYRVGFSLHKPRHWLFTTSYSVNNWANYVPFSLQNTSQDLNFQGADKNLVNSFTYAMGGEFTPAYNSIGNLFKRATYRAGFSYSKTPLVLSNRQINDFGINFGLSLPIGKSRGS